MEIKISTSQILKVLEILSWIIFIGLCVEAGSIIVNTFITLFINPNGVENFWKGKEYLSSLYQYDYGYSNCYVHCFHFESNYVLSDCKIVFR